MNTAADAPISKIFALPLRLGRGTRNEAPIFDRHGELVGECVDDDCDERASAFIRAVNGYEEIDKAEKATFGIAARLLRERDLWRDIAIRALPFLEDADNDPGYNEGVVRELIKRIREANSKSYDPTTQPYDEPFRHVDQSSKAWNGGGVGTALNLAHQQQDVLISQGASLCGECGGAGVILPADGLTLEDEIVISRTSGEDTTA